VTEHMKLAAVDAYCGRVEIDAQVGRRERVSAKTCDPRRRRYRDEGDLATLGRGRAVADPRPAPVSAHLARLVVHLRYRIGFQNRTLVVIRWGFGFVTRGRGDRLITRGAE
jgi:NADH dehydrogenase FAD-containing subunit